MILNLNEFNELIYGFGNLREAVLQLKVLGLQVFWSKVKYRTVIEVCYLFVYL